MHPGRRVYLLNPRQLSPETIAVAFAKTSRSPQAFDEIASELTDAASAQFHEKWVVGYGHASVAEHAVLHLAVENISRLAVEELESSRLASYTEKSTRYQKWDIDSFHMPEEFAQGRGRAIFSKAMRLLFQTYLEAMPELQEAAAASQPRRAEESQSAWDARIRTAYVDAARFLLPAAALANVGITINARNLEYQLTKFFSHPLAEVRQLADAIKQIAVEEVPTLVKYAEPSEYLTKSAAALQHCADNIPPGKPSGDEFCRLVHWDENLEKRLLTAAVYRFSDADYTQLTRRIEDSPPEVAREIAAALMDHLSAHDIPRREIEHATFTFDIILDQGAYYELKRHRMLTLTPQRLSTELGYAVPVMIAGTACLEQYHRAMHAAHEAYLKLSGVSPSAAAYVVPNAYNRRVLVTLNMRTAAHLIRLRSSSAAHFSIRRIALRMAEIIRQKTPLLSHLLPDNYGETWQSVEAQHFLQV